MLLVVGRVGMGVTCASEEVERLNGSTFSAGYAGIGGGTSLLFLNAFRRDANEDFFVNGELLVVATEDWVECVNGAAFAALRPVPPT